MSTQTTHRPRVLIAATGSVATVKVPEIAALIAEFAEVRIILTASAKHFWERASVYDASAWAKYQAMGSDAVQVYTDQNEWDAWNAIGDPVVHIQLRDWADMLIIAPLSANTLGKLAQGLCDNLATSVARAWDVRKPVMAAPAMNTHMWNHPFTSKHLSVLQSVLGYTVVEPMSKVLACGDEGKGALASVEVIVSHVQRLLAGEGGKSEASA